MTWKRNIPRLCLRVAFAVGVCALAWWVFTSTQVRCRVTVVDRGGLPIPDVRVLGVVRRGPVPEGVFVGITDQKGQVFCEADVFFLLFGEVSYVAVAPNDTYGVESVPSRRTACILTPFHPVSRYFNYSAPQDKYVDTGRMVNADDWDVEAGVAKELLSELVFLKGKKSGVSC